MAKSGSKEVTGYFTVKDRGLFGIGVPFPENDNRKDCRHIEVTLDIRTNGEWTHYDTGFGGLYRTWGKEQETELDGVISTTTVLLNDILNGTIQTSQPRFEMNERIAADIKKEKEERLQQIRELEQQLAELRKAV